MCCIVSYKVYIFAVHKTMQRQVEYKKMYYVFVTK
jgi:hypothetical protein